MKIKVKVYIPGFCSDELLDENSMIEIESGTRVNQVLKILKTPLVLRKVLLVTVNYQKVNKKYILKNNDVLSIFIPVSGG
jgi:molybdopterin converting factor small subunit